MKTLSFAIAITAFVLSSSVFAEGTKIENSTLTNASVNTNNLGLALGRNSTVNTGTIAVGKGAEIKNSTLTNASANTNNLGLALGTDSTVSTGSIDIK